MSTGYFQASISESERRRLREQERKRREEERKRREAERLRQLEEQKRRQREAERKKREQDLNLQRQKRAGLEQLLDTPLEREKARLNSRLLKIQAKIDSHPSADPQRSRLTAELQKLRNALETAKEKHIKKLVDKIDNFEKTCNQLEVSHPATSQQAPKVSQARVVEKLAAVRQKIAAFTEDHARLVQSKLDRIIGTIDQIENKLTGNLDFYYAMLKNIEAELFDLKKEAEQKFEQAEAQKTQLQEQISLVLARLDVIAQQSRFEPQRQQAIALRNALTDILQQDDLAMLTNGYQQFQSQVQELEKEFEELTNKENDRQFILQQTGEVLKEMGYEVIHTPYHPDNDPYGTLAMNFKAPAGQGVRISVTLSNSIHGQFCQLVPRENPQASGVDEQRLLSQCQSWCHDYEKLIEKLRMRGFDLQKYWHFPADLTQIDKIEVPAAMLEATEDEQYYEDQRYHTSEEPERRTM